MPGDAGGVGVDATGEISRQDPGLNRECLQQSWLDGRPGFGGGNPDLVGEAGFDIVIDLFGQSVGRRGVEIRFVLDRDQPPHPVGVGSDPFELNPVALAAGLYHATVGRTMDGFADISPRIVGLGECVTVPCPLSGRVADDMQEVGIEFVVAEGRPGLQCVRITLDNDGVPAPVFGAELPSNKIRRVIAGLGVAAGRPREFRPPTDTQLVGKLRVGGCRAGHDPD